MKKLTILAGLILAPSLCLADRLGGLKANTEVLLSTQGIRNQNTLQSGATFYVSSGTVQTRFNVNGRMDVLGDFNAGDAGRGQIYATNSDVQVVSPDSSNYIQVNNTDTSIVGDFTLTDFNCTGNTNGGKLTTDANGVVSCGDDISGGGGGGTTIWGQYNESVINNAVSTVTTNGVIKSSNTASGKYAVFLNYNTTQFLNTASTFTANSSSFTMYGPNIPGTAITINPLTAGTSNFIRNTLTPPTTTQVFSVALASSNVMETTTATVRGGELRAYTMFGSTFSVGDVDDGFYFESAVYPGHKLSLRGGQAIMASDTGGALDLASDGTVTLSNTFAALIYLGSISASFDAPDSGLDGGALNLIGGDGASGAGGPVYITGGLSGGNPTGGEVLIAGGDGGTTKADVVLNVSARVHADGQIDTPRLYVNNNMVIEASQINVNTVPLVISNADAPIYIDDGSVSYRIILDPALGDATLTGAVNAATGTFSDRLQIAGQDVCRENGVDCPAFSGGGASVLAVGTGTATNFTNNVTSPTAAISFHGNLFRVTTGGTTSFVTLDTATANGLLMISSAAGTYLTLSSATATYFNKNLPYIASANVNASLVVTANGTAGATPTFSANSSSVTLYGPNIPAASISAGSLGSSVLASSLTATGVTAGSYTNTNLTVDAQGRITTASNGSAGSGGTAAANTLFISTMDFRVQNTVTITTITAGYGVGSLTLPANFFTQGQTIEFYALGLSSAVTGDTLRIKVLLGTTTVMDSGAAQIATGLANRSNDLFRIDAALTCRTTGLTGTVRGQAAWRQQTGASAAGGTPAATGELWPPTTTNTTIDTTRAYDVNVVFEWSAANMTNDIRVTNYVLRSSSLTVASSASTIPSSTTVTTTYKAAVCQGPNVSLGFSGFAASTPTATCVSGTNSVFGTAQFVDTSTRSVQDHFQLPTGWIGNIDANIIWRSTQTSGNVVWKVRTACVADAEVADPSWNTESTVTDAAKGTTLQFNTAAMTAITITGCAAGEELFFDFTRDPAHASDTLAATADLISLQFVLRRTIF